MSSKLNHIIERSAQLHEEFQSLRRKPGPEPDTAADKGWHPRFEVYHHEDNLFIDVELPGVPPEAFTVESKPDMVLLHGEKPGLAHLPEREEIVSSREFGPFSTQFAIPPGYTLDTLEQRMNHGVLHLKVHIVPRANLPDAQ